MERLRIDSYSPASSKLAARRLGDSSDVKAAGTPVSASPVAAARALRESMAASGNTVFGAAQPLPQRGLAQAYVTAQDSVFPQYEPCEGWTRGTIFVALDKPLEGVNRCDKR